MLVKVGFSLGCPGCKHHWLLYLVWHARLAKRSTTHRVLVKHTLVLVPRNGLVDGKEWKISTGLYTVAFRRALREFALKFRKLYSPQELSTDVSIVSVVPSSRYQRVPG